MIQNASIIREVKSKTYITIVTSVIIISLKIHTSEKALGEKSSVELLSFILNPLTWFTFGLHFGCLGLPKDPVADSNVCKF